MAKTYRRYDPRLKNLVANAQGIARFEHLGIPKSTLKEWVKAGAKDYFTLPELDVSQEDLLQENMELKSKLQTLTAQETLLMKTIRIFGFQIQYKRLPSAAAKTEILDALAEAVRVIPLLSCLKVIGLSLQRYRHWLKRQVRCHLEDQPSCPRITPTRLSALEVLSIKRLKGSRELTHLSTLSLSWLAKKTGEVFASPSTWSRVIRDLGLKKNRVRIYPPKPKLGIRALRPGEIWHLDVTILRLQDGTRAFVQAVIDNYSRYVLAWNVSPEYGGQKTQSLLTIALQKSMDLGISLIPNVWVDSGTENLNQHVDQLVTENLIRRTVAQIDIEFSNSMIEMLFHRLKHRYLFTFPLSSFETLVKGVDFFLTESNDKIPHAALRGATPLEMITGRWGEDQLNLLKEKIIEAKKLRCATNKAQRCGPCLA